MGQGKICSACTTRKTQEIQDLEHQIERARVYLQAIQDSIRALPREAPNSNGARAAEADSDLRAGTRLAKAKEALLRKGAPMHINELLAAIGVEITKETRNSSWGPWGATCANDKYSRAPIQTHLV